MEMLVSEAEYSFRAEILGLRVELHELLTLLEWAASIL